MAELTLVEAQKRVTQLYKDLARMADRDAEQEVQGIAVPVLDAVLAAVRVIAETDPVVASIRDVISVEAIASGEEAVRAVDALLVVGQLRAAIGSPSRAHFG